MRGRRAVLAGLIVVLISSAPIAAASATSIISPVAILTTITESDAAGKDTVELLVFWRGSPGWYLGSGGSGVTGSHSRRFYRETITYNGLQFTLEFDVSKRVAVVQGKTVVLGQDNVIFVDDVDSPTGARVTGQMRVHPVMPGSAGQIGLVLKKSPEIMSFLRCDALPANGRGKGFLEPLCLENIGVNKAGQELVSFSTSDKATVLGHEYGAGVRGVILVAHGGYSYKERWEKQARLLADAGFRVLVFDTRAGVELKRTGKETDCLYDPVCMSIDVLAAVRYLRASGATTVSIVGGSAGGGAVAQASVDARPGEIDRIVLLAPMEIAAPEKMKSRKLFVVARDDANGAGLRLPGIRKQYERSPDPKELILLDGSAHGQLMFDTPSGDALMREILRFLAAN